MFALESFQVTLWLALRAVPRPGWASALVAELNISSMTFIEVMNVSFRTLFSYFTSLPSLFFTHVLFF